MGFLSSVAFFAAVLFLASEVAIEVHAAKGQCKHNPAEQPIVGVYIDGHDSGRARERRSPEHYKPMRVYTHYDDSVYTELSYDDKYRLKDQVLYKVLYFLKALKVYQLTKPILLDRRCTNDDEHLRPGQHVRQCMERCENVTKCGEVVIPEEHLKRCVECGGTSDCATPEGSVNGTGIPDSDFILYVSAKPCEDEDTLAYAGSCQLESYFDRPIAGHINFCPSEFSKSSVQENIATALHELTHILAFSNELFPFYRDEDGNPRTPRDENGYPPKNSYGNYVPSNNTVATVTYNDWLTRNGRVSREVKMIVTPKVVENARLHFGCDDLMGVELENQGGDKGDYFVQRRKLAAGAHWEHRVLGNEAMTGVQLFNGVLSNITMGLLADSGWYVVDYSYAEPLAWGRNKGCKVPHGSCAEHIKYQQALNRSLSPFCNVLQGGDRQRKTTCTVDRLRFASCNLKVLGDVPAKYQYFNSGYNFGTDVAPQVGSSFNYTDFCPFNEPKEHDPKCTNIAFQPKINVAGELYGPSSRCIEHGKSWTKTNFSDGTVTTKPIPVGCYEYSCSSSGVSIWFLGRRYLCTCEGEELKINVTFDGYRHEGSFICPSCSSMCYDQVEKCPSPEPPACPMKKTYAEPLPIGSELYPPVHVHGYCYHIVWRNPSNIDCNIRGITGYDIRLIDIDSGESEIRRVDSSATYYDLDPDKDALFSKLSTSKVQVRLVSNDYLGPFSKLKPLGCEAPHSSGLYFILRGKAFTNNSIINMADIGIGDNALLCKTDMEDCCGTPPNRAGEFYYPNGIRVPIRIVGHGVYRDRGNQYIRLNRREGVSPPAGRYMCEIPDANSEKKKLFITITS